MNAGQKRMRIAVLWVAAAVTYSFGMLMYLLVLPDALEEALAGEMEGMALGRVGKRGHRVQMRAAARVSPAR